MQLKCPIVGGGAANNSGKPGDGLNTGCGQIGIFVVTDTEVAVRTEMYNIHENILEECELELVDARTVSKINGMDAALYLEQQKEKHGFAKTDFESLTLSTKTHVNAHLNCADGIVRSGRDLEKEMLLRCVDVKEKQKLIEEFYQSSSENSIVFGCAGLKNILEHGFDCKCVGSFLYGEICCLGEESDFGNLMLSKIVFD